MSFRINGLAAYTVSGTTSLVATANGGLYQWLGNGCATRFDLPTGTLDITGIHRMVQANDCTYGTDKFGAVFKFDGTALTQPSILAADGVTPMDAVKDMVWMFNRLWFARGDYIYWTDVSGTVPAPETIVDAPVRIRAGGGDSIVRLVVYRQGVLLIFKRSSSGNGSIHVLDASANDPSYFSVQPWVDQIAITSPDAIVRAGNDNDADVLFTTREGFRSLRITSLDKITSPTLPFSENIKSYVDQFNYNQQDNAWAVVFDDELLWFMPTGSSTTPDVTLAWSFKEPQRKESLSQGWTVLNMMPATCGVVAALGGKPNLWIGTADNQVAKAFNQTDTTNLYQEISKRIDFGAPTHDKRLLKLIYQFDKGSSGTMTPKIQREDGAIYTLASRTIVSGGLVLPAVLPAVLGQTGISTESWDLRFDAAGAQIPRMQDVRVWLESYGNPKILGFELLAQVEKHRFTPLSSEQGNPVTAGAITGDDLTAAAVTME